VAVNSDGSIRWSVLRPDWVSSSPAVGADGTVYVGCYDGRLYALEPGSGNTRWSYDSRTFIFSSPAIGRDGSIYFGAGDSRLHSLSPSGVLRWSFQTGDWIDSSPAVAADGTVYFGSRDRKVYAVGPDGSERWRFTTGGSVYSSPAIGGDGAVYIASSDGKVYALSPSGEKRWEYETGGEILGSPSLGADGAVYIASLDGRVYALQPSNGWPVWSVRLGAPSISTPAVRGDGAVLIGGDDGVLRALSPASGGEIWRFDTRAAAGDGIESSVLVAGDGSIYFSSLDGKLYKLRGNGSPLSRLSAWPSFRGDVSRTGMARPATTGGQLLNLSSRALVPAGQTLIAGLGISGSFAKPYLLRGVGPSLDAFGLDGLMEAPTVAVFVEQKLLSMAEDWEAGDSAPLLAVGEKVGAFPLRPGGRDAAALLPLGPGMYSVHLAGRNGGAGVALLELYDGQPEDHRGGLINLSLRGGTSPGQGSLIAGIVVGGNQPARVLIRAVGPGLKAFGVDGWITRPRLALYSGDRLIATGEDWSKSGWSHDIIVATSLSGAFPLDPANQDAALTIILDPGPYTLQVSGVDSSVGEVLAEVYVLR
jgi:outer membrane protein assembly factor BamB